MKRSTELARSLTAPTRPVLFGWALQFSAPERTPCMCTCSTALWTRVIGLFALRQLVNEHSKVPAFFFCWFHWHLADCIGALYSGIVSHIFTGISVLQTYAMIKCFSLSVLFCISFVSYNYCYLWCCSFRKNFLCTSNHWSCFLHFLILLYLMVEA